MTPGVRPLVAGNWKMNGLSGSLAEIDAIRQAVDAGESGSAELLVCPPATLIAQAALRIRSADLSLGAQDCYTQASGAFTGDISAAMLKDAGATYVIVGHSERRTYHHETDELVRAKAEAALKAGLTPIVCVGETQAEREAGQQAAVVIRQLRGSLPPEASSETVVVAYEPIWAIGTGLTPTPKDVAVVHNGIRALLADMFGPPCAKIRLLYGGSVKPTNCSELLTLDNVDGALVGGASLKATEFLAIAAGLSLRGPASPFPRISPSAGRPLHTNYRSGGGLRSSGSTSWRYLFSSARSIAARIGDLACPPFSIGVASLDFHRFSDEMHPVADVNAVLAVQRRQFAMAGMKDCADGVASVLDRGAPGAPSGVGKGAGNRSQRAAHVARMSRPFDEFEP